MYIEYLDNERYEVGEQELNDVLEQIVYILSE